MSYVSHLISHVLSFTSPSQVMNTQALLNHLQKANIQTWTELGQFLDQLKNTTKPSFYPNSLTFNDFKNKLKGGIGFLTFHYGAYGVTVEMYKYASALKKILPDVQFHFIGGRIPLEADTFLGKNSSKLEVPAMQGFGDWALYEEFYGTRLEKNSPQYKQLLHKFWQETLTIVEKLGIYIEKHDIQLLYLLNICSNPGNVSLSLATVLVAEYLQIPVINNSHEFYWEGGSRESDRVKKGRRRGPRDFFFTNAHISDFFSIIDRLFPWESKQWFSLNINKSQSQKIIDKKGFNPANVGEIGTAVDTEEFVVRSKRKTINARLQLDAMLKRYGKKLALYTPEQILEKKLVDPRRPQPILVGASQRLKPSLSDNNIVLLQPTRVTLRKRIELGFWLISLLFQNPDFITNFEGNPQLTLTILVSGAVPVDQMDYFKKIIYEFGNLLQTLPTTFKHRLFLGFLFSEIDTLRFKKHFEQPIGMAGLYNIASLVMLPSETEGRGLPIIEATACGVPIFCNRYYPEEVYSEVVGKHLSKKDRLKVIEFEGEIQQTQVQEIIERIFFPQNYIKELEHNQRVVQERFSLDALRKDLERILYKFYLQLKDDTDYRQKAAQLLQEYLQLCSLEKTEVGALVNTEQRTYLPGYGRLGFFLRSKSLIDAHVFRKEVRLNKGMMMRFSLKVFRETLTKEPLTEEQFHYFFNLIDNVLNYSEEGKKITHDHAFNFHYKNTRFYPYQSLTYQEMTGLISLIFHEVAEAISPQNLESSPHFFTDWKLALFQLTNSANLAIDNRDLLLKRIKKNVPIAYFPGKYIRHEVDVFVLQTIRYRLNMKPNDELTEAILEKHHANLQPIFIFCLARPVRRWLTVETFEQYLNSGEDKELQLLVKYNICQVVKSEQWCVGVHLGQQGTEGLESLQYVQQHKGFIIANGEHAAVMTDILAIDRFHIGKAVKKLTANILGIKEGSGFIQFVPAGIRSTLGYPLPNQTAIDVYEVRNSRLYRDLCRKQGETKVLQSLYEYTAKTAAPIKFTLEHLKELERPRKRKAASENQYFTGIYADGKPYTGVLIRLYAPKWSFEVLQNNLPTNPHHLIEDYNDEQAHKARIAWNGNFAYNRTNTALTTAQGLSYPKEAVFTIKKGQCSTDLRGNIPALLVDKEGKICIELVKPEDDISEVETGIETGIFLVKEKKICIKDDKNDKLRTSKIGIGLDKKGNLLIIAMNGCIRESVGATYQELAEKMMDFGVVNGVSIGAGIETLLLEEGQLMNTAYVEDVDYLVVACRI